MCETEMWSRQALLFSYSKDNWSMSISVSPSSEKQPIGAYLRINPLMS
jgi:hypothetical protein